jgi:hypothetical protein
VEVEVVVGVKVEVFEGVKEGDEVGVGVWV